MSTSAALPNVSSRAPFAGQIHVTCGGAHVFLVAAEASVVGMAIPYITGQTLLADGDMSTGAFRALPR